MRFPYRVGSGGEGGGVAREELSGLRLMSARGRVRATNDNQLEKLLVVPWVADSRRALL